MTTVKKGWYSRLAYSLVAIHLSLLLYSARLQSPTLNEPAHLVSGLSNWQFGRFESYSVNPPLTRMVAALPVLLVPHRTDWSSFYTGPGARPEFPMGEDFVRANGALTGSLVVLARVACLPLSALAALICFYWARDLYGDEAGLCAVALWCFDPNAIAHGQLITPDAAGAAGYLLAGYTFWRWLRLRSVWTFSAATFGLSFALLSRTTAVLLLLLWPLLLIGWHSRRATVRRQALRQALLHLFAMQCISLFILNGVYYFNGTFSRLGSYAFVSPLFAGGTMPGESGNRFADTLLGHLPVPLPRDFLSGLDLQLRDADAYQWDSYLLGEWRHGRWWYYYAVAFIVKCPLGTLVLLVTAVCARLRKPRVLIPGAQADEAVLLIPAIVLFVVISGASGFNHHFRYALPCVGTAIVFGTSCLYNAGWRLRTWCSLSVLASVISSLSTYPHSLSYFNALAGGYAHGDEVLLHSNIDWGQDLSYAEEWAERHPECRPLYMAYYGACRFRDFGVQAAAAPFSPGSDVEDRSFRPGWYAISVNYLRGCEWRMTHRWAYRGFLNQPILDRCGGSIRIYHLDLKAAEEVTREARAIAAADAGLAEDPLTNRRSKSRLVSSTSALSSPNGQAAP